METILGLGLKSFLIAGIALIVLRLTARRSASERSLVAHLGLFALVALPLASLALPSLSVALPEALTPTSVVTPAAPSSDIAKAKVREAVDSALAGKQSATPMAAAPVATAAVEPSFDWTPYAYAVPAAALLIITLLALLRLFALRSRAQILVDPVWLTALAHAQRRMGFKNGTALLTSNELVSPISWGLMRPVILLNDEALQATGEAEAIIAHELAHVARLDWAKLMLARVATAVFWFNPLAWVLAREAHQLREEAADDAVLAANIDGADYAQLLVGVARHECRGILLGAHGVAPSKGSLRRRVSRVLDGTLARGPGSRGWFAGFAAGMLVMAAPLAALTFSPANKGQDKLSDKAVKDAARPVKLADLGDNFDLPVGSPTLPAGTVMRSADGGTIQQNADGSLIMRSANGATITLFAPDAQGRRAMVMKSPNGATLRYADAREAPAYEALALAGRQRVRAQHDQADSELDRAIEMKALGVTPEYLAAIKRVAPQLRNMDADEAVQLRALNITPDYIQQLAAAGFKNLDADELTEAKAVGVTGDYIRSMRAAGLNGSLDEFVQLRAVGVNARDAAGNRGADADELIDRKVGKKGAWHFTMPHIDIPRIDVNVQPPEPPEPPEEPGE